MVLSSELGLDHPTDGREDGRGTYPGWAQRAQGPVRLYVRSIHIFDSVLMEMLWQEGAVQGWTRRPRARGPVAWTGL